MFQPLAIIIILAFLILAPAPAAAQEAAASRVIVALNTDFRVARAANPMGIARAFALSQARGLNARVTAGSDKWTIPFLALEVDPAARAALEESPYVTAIYEDYLAAPTLAESVPQINAPAAWAQGFDGAGQTVVILDSGIDAAHSFFGGRVVTEACFSTNNPSAVYGGAESLCPNALSSQTGPGAASLTRCALFAVNCSHGTHVAGIAAGSSPSLKGVAPAANLIAVQIFTKFRDCSASPGDQPCILTYTSDQIRALEYVYALRAQYSIAAVNMSLGGGAFSSQALCDSQYAPTKAAIDLLRSANIATIIASGNDYSATTITAPGCISSAVAVGAVADDDRVARYSNINPMVDLLAPGGRSPGAPAGTGILSSYPGGGYGTLSGTSMAAPHVAGAWAVIRQAAPSASVSQVLAAFQQSGALVTDGPTRDDNNCPCSGLAFPRVNLYQALAFFAIAPPIPTLNIPGDWTLVGTTPTLRWNAVQGAAAYAIQIALDEDFTQPLPGYPHTVYGTSHTPPPLTPGGTYYWRVRSLNPFGYPSDYSDFRRLFVNGAPQPGFSDSPSISVTWGAITSATSYEVWLDDDPAFRSPWVFYRESPDIFFDGLPNGVYYWRVRAISAVHLSPWSARQSFTILTPQ
jgi:subtilisin family serine protease